MNEDTTPPITGGVVRLQISIYQKDTAITVSLICVAFIMRPLLQVCICIKFYEKVIPVI